MSTTVQPASAVKTAVKIDLVYVDDEAQKMRINAIVAGGKIASQEMYCHLIEWNGKENELQPIILTTVDDSLLIFEAEWGYGDTSDVRFEFLDRPLSIGQEVIRTDTESGEKHAYTYRIIGITDLLK